MTQMTEQDKFERVVQRIAPHSTLLRIWPLHGGASAHMTALALLLHDGNIQQVVVRRPGVAALKHNPQIATHEFKLLQILKSANLSVPTPIYLDETGDIFALPYLVTEYVDGQPEFAPANLSDFIRQIASQLVRIHGLDVATTDLSFLPVQTNSLDTKIEERLAASDCPLDDIQIQRILATARTVRQPNRPVLLHGDFWPGNVLWKDGQLVAIVDWEDAELGDSLADFAISRLDTLLVFGPDALREFTNQYCSLSNADFTHLAYWDLYAALRAAPHLAVWPAVYPHFGRHDITEESMRVRHTWFLEMTLDRLSGL